MWDAELKKKYEKALYQNYAWWNEKAMKEEVGKQFENMKSLQFDAFNINSLTNAFNQVAGNIRSWFDWHDEYKKRNDEEYYNKYTNNQWRKIQNNFRWMKRWR